MLWGHNTSCPRLHVAGKPWIVYTCFKEMDDYLFLHESMNIFILKIELLQIILKVTQEQVTRVTTKHSGNASSRNHK